MPADRSPPTLELANRVLACRSFDDVANTLLPTLSGHFGALSSCAFEMRHDGGRLRLERAVQRGMPAGALSDYGQHFVGLDPICAPSFDARDARVVAPSTARVARLSDRCGTRSLLGSEYYNDFLRAVRIRHVIGMMARPEGDASRIVVLGFHRPEGAQDFSAELDGATALAPAFQATVERIALLESLARVAAGTPAPSFDTWADRFRLTRREADVARAVLDGLRNAEVAARLDLSPRTVENHLRAVFAKAGVRSRAQLLRSAFPLPHQASLD